MCVVAETMGVWKVTLGVLGSRFRSLLVSMYLGCVAL